MIALVLAGAIFALVSIPAAIRHDAELPVSVTGRRRK